MGNVRSLCAQGTVTLMALIVTLGRSNLLCVRGQALLTPDQLCIKSVAGEENTGPVIGHFQTHRGSESRSAGPGEVWPGQSPRAEISCPQ